MKKYLILLAILIVLAGGGYYVYRQQTVTAATPTLATTKVERRPLRIAVASTGRVVSNLDVDIKCKASGAVIKLPFDISDTVKKGDLLVEIDPVDTIPIVRKAEATVAASTAKLEQARWDLKVATESIKTTRDKAQAALDSAIAHEKDLKAKAARTRELFAKKLASQEELDTAETSAAQAVADVASAQAVREDVKTQEIALELKKQAIALAAAQLDADKVAKENADQQLRDTKVFAPIDGVVAARNVQIGTIIASGITNIGGGTTVITLSDLSHIFVYAAVDESDIGKVATGQAVDITADAYPNVHFTGKVIRIATKGANASNVVTFEVRIEVTSANKRMLKPEMTTNVEVINTDEESVLQVPAQALVRKRGGSRAAASQPTTAPEATTEATTRGGPAAREKLRPARASVTLVKPDGSQEQRDITIGRTDGGNFEVLSGLQEGATILLNKNETDSRWKGGARPPGMMGGGGPRR